MNSRIKLSSHYRTARRSFILFLLTFALSSTAISQSAAGNLREQASLVSEFEVNGLKVLIKRRPTASTVAAGLFIRGGARNITAENAGIEALMLETAAEGSRKYPREMLRRELASTGTVIGSGINNDFSVLSLASTLENFKDSWDIFTDIAMNPAFDPQDLQRVKDRVMTGLRERETDNDNFLEILQGRLVYKGHPYSNDVSGTMETIPKFTAKDLKEFHQGVMETSRLLLVVVGSVEPSEMRGMIESTLAKLPRGNYKPTPMPDLQINGPSVNITQRRIPTNYVQGVFRAPSIDHPDYYATKIAVAILQARVFQEVRVERQLSYAPNAELNSDGSNTGFIYVTTVNPNEAVEIMLNEMDNLKVKLENQPLLAGISGHFLTLHYIDQETNGAQARELGKYELIGGGWRNSFDFLNKIKSVTPQEVQTVARKYFKNINFVVIGNPDSINKAVFMKKD